MNERRRALVRRGVLPLLAYAVLTAAMDVYAGNRFATISPAAVAAVSFTFTMVFFLALEWSRRGMRQLRELTRHRRDLVAINVTTAVTWLATLYALDFLEPAIVNVLGLALGPVITVLAGPLLRRGSTVLKSEIAVSLGICVLLGALVWVSFSGRSGLAGVTVSDAVAGLAFTVACAVGSSFNIIYMKRLGDAGCDPNTVLATRFFLMSAVAWVLVAVTDAGDLRTALVPGAVVAVIGVGLPIYVLQIGIRHTEPITTSLLIALSPLFAFVMQFADGRLRFSAFTLAGIVGVVALVALGTVVRGRQPMPAPAGGNPIGNDESGGPPTMTCAIVDAYGAGRLLPAALRARDVRFVHVRSEFPDTRLDYRPEDFVLDVHHTGDLERTVRILQEHGVTRVVAAAESGVLLADQLAAALGVPGNGMRNAIARRDKHEMQRVVRAAGFAAADDFRSDSSEEVVEWAQGRDAWPVVLKPVLSAGTDNVLICRDVDEVRAAHKRIMSSADRYGRRNDVVLAQQFLVGVEHYVNTVSYDGVHRVIEVWRYHKREIDGRSVYDYEDLLSLDEPGASAVVEYVRAVLDALEIRQGAAHTEVMLTDDGPVLIECGARLGGGQMPELLTRCVGTDQVDSLAFSIADPESFRAEAEAPYQLKSQLRCVNLISPADGIVPADWHPVERLASFAGMAVSLRAGSTLERTVDMATCPGTVYLNSDEVGSLESDYRELRDLELTGLYG
ncbi:EamA family transporter [Myceligenerans crystallogenes]|uniref:ATP-grasp domain-containing protein n=1 Tax=Myceligenerans crystallogenes TaxID=316335 RepID=A0ABN2NG25_9MICO